MESTKDMILSTLIAAEGKAVTRDMLVYKTRVSDRIVRRCIAALRDEGYLIGQSSNCGYSLGNMDDVNRLMTKEEARAKTIQRRIRKMKRAIENQNQLIMEV